MDQATLMKLGLGLAAAFAAYKFIPSQPAKIAALGVIGVIVAKQLPYVNVALA